MTQRTEGIIMVSEAVASILLVGLGSDKVRLWTLGFIGLLAVAGMLHDGYQKLTTPDPDLFKDADEKDLPDA